MEGNKNFSWMVSRRGLVSLLGAEYRIMQQSGSGVLKKFYWSAVLILLIMLLSICSIFYAVDLLAHNYTVEIILSIFISILFMLMYVFLLNTFTKENFDTRNRIISLRNLSRIGFVMFMGFIISKPIEIYLLKNKLTHQVTGYRHLLQEHHAKKVNAVYQSELHQLRQDSSSQQANLLLFATPALQSDIQTIKQKIQRLETERKQTIESSANKINASDFFIYQVQQSARSWIAWTCCVLVIGLFVLPGFIVYSISGDDAYFTTKKEQETGLVKKEYAIFKQKYSALFLEKFQLEKEWYSVYTDAPFNTTRVQPPDAKTQHSFFEKYLKNKT